MVRYLRFARSLFVQSIFAATALLDCEFIVSGLSIAVFGMALFVSTGHVQAETFDASFASDDVTYESDEYWWGRSELRSVSQADYRTSPRIALRNEAYYAQAQPTGDSGLPTIPPPSNTGAAPPQPTGDSGLPKVPPQQDTGAGPKQPTGDSGLPVPPQPNANGAPLPVPANAPPESLSGELKKIEAEEKKKEKPAIPDLAKGILIASNDGDLTFKPGLRIQPRYMFDSGNDNNDFFIRRFRLKGSGSAYGIAKYGVEMKIDNEGRFGVSPAARAENAWLDFPMIDECAYLRCGLYDLPFSRDALTSDSKLLFMDRTLIKEQLTAVGMADNTYGVMLHGRPNCGRWEYAVGIFDNDRFERTEGFGVVAARESDELMPAGRIVLNLLDPMKPADGYADYMESYIGKGQRLEIGANAAHLGDVTELANEFDLTAWGVDLFANSGHWTFQTEYDQIIENLAGGGDIIADGWYAQAGYLFNLCDPCAEFCVRYEQLNPLVGENLNWVRVGMNFYIREHNLKVQTDYCIRSHNDLTAALPGGLGFFDENVFEVQLQLDF